MRQLAVFIVIFGLSSVLGNSLNTIKLNHPKFQCEIVCSRAGGQNVFDDARKTCKCFLSKKVDDTDLALLRKYARVIGLNVTSIEPIDHSTIIIKREVHQDVATTTEGQLLGNAETSTQSPPTTTAEVPTTQQPEAVVGQKLTLKKLHERLVGQRRREPKHITQEQQKRILQQMRDHITRLGATSEQRTRQLEIDALAANLKQLNESVIIQVPTQRSRLRVVAEEARKRTLRPRLTTHSRLVGAAGPQIETTTTKADLSADADSNVEAAKEIKRLHPHFTVITQSPTLFDEQ